METGIETYGDPQFIFEAGPDSGGELGVPVTDNVLQDPIVT